MAYKVNESHALTLSEALASDRLEEFIEQAERAGVGTASEAEFGDALTRVVKAPRPEDRTSRSASRDGSTEK
jgi:hypothetical protein